MCKGTSCRHALTLGAMVSRATPKPALAVAKDNDRRLILAALQHFADYLTRQSQGLTNNGDVAAEIGRDLRRLAYLETALVLTPPSDNSPAA